MVVMFDRYRVLAWVGDSPYTVALVRDPARGRAVYLACDRGAAAMYRNANVLTLVLEQATMNGLTVVGRSGRWPVGHFMGRSRTPAATGRTPASGAGRRRRAASTRHHSHEAAPVTKSAPAAG